MNGTIAMQARILLKWSRSSTGSQELQWGRLSKIYSHLSMSHVRFWQEGVHGDQGILLAPDVQYGRQLHYPYSLWGLCNVPDIRPAEDNCKIHPHYLGYWMLSLSVGYTILVLAIAAPQEQHIIYCQPA